MRYSIVVLLLFVPMLFPSDVTLEWDHSISDNVTGYRIYYGNDSRQYDGHHEVPYQTTWTVAGLKPGTWYFTATAIDGKGNESTYSNEVSKTIEDQSSDLIVTAQAAAVDWYGVVCLATTNIPASAMFRYRRIQSGESWLYIVASPEPRTEHRVIIYEIGAANYYEYEWILTSVDNSGIITKGTFQTR